MSRGPGRLALDILAAFLAGRQSPSAVAFLRERVGLEPVKDDGTGSPWAWQTLRVLSAAEWRLCNSGRQGLRRMVAWGWVDEQRAFQRLQPPLFGLTERGLEQDFRVRSLVERHTLTRPQKRKSGKSVSPRVGSA